MERVLWVVGLVIFWVAMIGLMFIGWRGRARRQKDSIGELPTVPATLGELLVMPTTGLYVGSTIAPSWQDRIAVGDLGFRSTCEISRYSGGILLERTGASAIWIPQKSIRAIRTENGLAGKVMSKDGVLVIRWELPSGTEIDTGVRGDDKLAYPDWVKPLTGSNPDASTETKNNEDASSGEIEQNGKNA
ncbi:transporter [Rhodococcus sp. IEGM 1379]|uniref:PH-like domain-containing protein n=1 Tax=Rhodococcus sp. IEGM 1379 TaxID=3047086 RepID=UPI0024B85FB6|nr:transporter [Rhodococcus sp. IEGM 1379]MDI9918433.1 transporter [Rhodococcus sp. IEGM 1379]